MAVLIDKNGNIVATHSIKLRGHYDPERWDSDNVSKFIEEKMQLLRDKADIELLQITSQLFEWFFGGKASMEPLKRIFRNGIYADMVP